MQRGCRKILFGKMIGARIENAFFNFIFFLRVVREASAYKMYENVFFPFLFDLVMLKKCIFRRIRSLNPIPLCFLEACLRIPTSTCFEIGGVSEGVLPMA